MATAVFNLGVVTHNARKCGGFVIGLVVVCRDRCVFVFKVNEVKTGRMNGERMIQGTIETLKLSEDWWRAKTSIDLLSGGKTPHFLRLVLLKHADDAGKQRRSQ